MERQYHLLARLEHDFDHVVETCEALMGHVEHAPPKGWVLGEIPFNIAWLRHALLDFWYQDGQDGRATRNYIGLIAADSTLLAYVADINHAKQTFAATLAEIRQDAPSLLPEIKAVLPFRHPTLHDHLRGQGLARLHLKQCWRHLPVADAPLSRVRLAWYTSGRSIKRLSVRDAERRLLEMDTESPHIRIQLRHLADIPDGEPLAQVQTQAPVMRANLFFREALADGRMRRAMNLPLPLFIPSEDGCLPSHNTPKATPPSTRTRAQRADTKLEDTPFLPSLRVYRYR
ncbi:DNA replication terminus site-binding protein [Chromohalobacter canadensis]|uniref:DNA replication terminus site-binding protein n=1 Tax=Chromohalobacter canadensis TaxID=141389 RepID=UPI002410207F|nr:DNA replication terminus site-binding protein [Chromohalobacter canadensis]